MKYLDAYRDPRATRDLLDEIRRTISRPRTLLEVCGGQAQNLIRFVTDRSLPEGLEVHHGPGCPVSAFPTDLIARAVMLASDPEVILCTPGDLLGVPAGRDSLALARERGGDVRLVYSPLDALALARKHPSRSVVVLAVGYETTAPAAAAAVIEADRSGLENFTLLPGLFRHVPVVEAVLAGAQGRSRGVLVSGPVCAVTGVRGYEALAEKFGVPIVVTGPEPVDLLEGILRAVRQLERGTHEVENQYARAVRPDGNPQAISSIGAVFEASDAGWRGLGRLARSRLVLREGFRRFDAAWRFPSSKATLFDSSECRDGEVLSGRIKPNACPAFGTRCTPEHPLGAAMVSAEGPCSAYYRYRRPTENPDENPVAASSLVVLPAHVSPG